MKWNGRTYKPANAQYIKKKKEFDFQEALKALGEKEMPVWNPVIAVYVPPSPEPQPSPTNTPTPSTTPAVTPTNTSSPTPSITATATPGNTPTATPSNTPSNTPSVTPSITASVTPTITSSNTPTTTPSITPTNTPSNTPSITPTNTPSTTPSNTPSITPTNTPSTTPSNTPSITPTNTPSTTPSNTPSITPSITPSNTPSNTPSITPTNTPTPSTSPLPSGTTEARAYLTAVVNAGGTLSSTISAATETLFTTLVSSGLWDRVIQFYPLLGATSAGCAIEGKTATSNITWNGGMTFTSNGAKANGTNAYGVIGYNDNTSGTLNSYHHSFYSNESLAKNDGYALGVSQGGNANQLFFYQTTNDAGGKMQTSNAAMTGPDSTTSLGYYICERDAGNNQRIYKNGTDITTANNTSASTGKPNANLNVFAQNGGNFRTGRCAFISIGLSLTSGQITSLQNAVHTFNTSIGRNY